MTSLKSTYSSELQTLLEYNQYLVGIGDVETQATIGHAVQSVLQSEDHGTALESDIRLLVDVVSETLTLLEGCGSFDAVSDVKYKAFETSNF
jgi:hypothetical protein